MGSAHTGSPANSKPRHEFGALSTRQNEHALDAIVTVSHEAVYRALVEAAGNGGKLVQTYANAWHASFSADQYLATLAAMEHWLDTGVRPDASFFPASKGFDTAFVPPPWPY